MSAGLQAMQGRCDPFRLGELASSALDRQREADAIGEVEAAARLARTNAALWQWTGLLHRGLDQHDRAIKAFDRAAALAPRDARIAHGRARVALEAGRPAIGLFETALRLRPNDHDAKLGLVAALMADGQADAAMKGLDAALLREPSWIAGHDALARLRWMMGNQSGFLDSCEQALGADPSRAPLWHFAIVALIHGRQFERAIAAIAVARRHLGPQTFLEANEAVARSELGETKAPEMLFERLGPPEDATLAVHIVRHLLRNGRTADALPVIDAWLDRPEQRLMWPYASAAWRLLDDPRGRWLDGSPDLVSVVDLDDRSLSLDRMATLLRGLHQARAQQLDQSVRGGTQTDGALFSRLDPEIRSLRRAVETAVAAHLARMPARDPRHPTLASPRDRPPRFAGSWSVRLRSGGHHAAHIHPAGWISSAFYVALPPAVDAGGREGWLTLGSPQAELGLRLPPTLTIQPKPGRLVLFPSTMWHGTEPFGAGERLTVAFDVAVPIT